MNTFDREFKFFVANQDRLVEQHSGKMLVIYGEEVEGVYDTALQAYVEAQKKHPLGTFMIQPCVAGPGAYTVSISTLGLI